MRYEKRPEISTYRIIEVEGQGFYFTLREWLGSEIFIPLLIEKFGKHNVNVIDRKVESTITDREVSEDEI